MLVVCFNGPPYSGKDTLAQMLLEHIELVNDNALPIRLASFSLPLREIAYTAVGFDGELDGEDYARFKKTDFRLGNHRVSGRQLLIDISERFLKPCYSERVMADLLIVRHQGFDGLLLIRDNGFQVEVNPLLEAYGTRNVFIVRVHRPTSSFAGDSREWVNHHDSGCSWDIDNDGTLENLRVRASDLYRRLRYGMGWKI